ncbi:MAG: cysteine--tRNA ligase [Malacoplasma sp.]|nr:cysteine--tRNA ligase [Malacoplasma sp.]
MKLYEHLSKKYIEVSDNDKEVKIYVCGPTVYNYVHIGNLRPIIVFDVLNRLLLELGYTVKFIHNITDIDDKIIAKAKESNKSEIEVASFFENHYFEILKTINIYQKNMIFPRVSDHIEDIEKYIQVMIDNKSAYFNEGDVYFDTSKFKDYGIISNKKIDDLLVGEKSLNNANKSNLQDFVLWKKTNQGLNWKASFSTGRPGWHTECSCMINKYLGDQIDIHGGGIDLKFPHHENENVQNLAVKNVNLARIWMHVGHLNINNEKMSKSLNNFILAKDLLDKESANTIRWFFYQTNYSNPLNFSDQNIEEARNNINSIIYNLNVFKTNLIIINKLNLDLKFDHTYIKELENYFNFPNQISFVNEKIKSGNNLLKAKKYDELNALYFNIHYLLTNILGIQIQNIHTSQNIALIKEWVELKNKKDYEKSDAIRKLLLEKKLI